MSESVSLDFIITLRQQQQENEAAAGRFGRMLDWIAEKAKLTNTNLFSGPGGKTVSDSFRTEGEALVAHGTKAVNVMSMLKTAAANFALNTMKAFAKDSVEMVKEQTLAFVAFRREFGLTQSDFKEWARLTSEASAQFGVSMKSAAALVNYFSVRGLKGPAAGQLAGQGAAAAEFGGVGIETQTTLQGVMSQAGFKPEDVNKMVQAALVYGRTHGPVSTDAILRAINTLGPDVMRGLNPQEVFRDMMRYGAGAQKAGISPDTLAPFYQAAANTNSHVHKLVLQHKNLDGVMKQLLGENTWMSGALDTLTDKTATQQQKASASQRLNTFISNVGLGMSANDLANLYQARKAAPKEARGTSFDEIMSRSLDDLVKLNEESLSGTERLRTSINKLKASITEGVAPILDKVAGSAAESIGILTGTQSLVRNIKDQQRRPGETEEQFLKRFQKETVEKSGWIGGLIYALGLFGTNPEVEQKKEERKRLANEMAERKAAEDARFRKVQIRAAEIQRMEKEIEDVKANIAAVPGAPGEQAMLKLLERLVLAVETSKKEMEDERRGFKPDYVLHPEQNATPSPFKRGSLGRILRIPRRREVFPGIGKYEFE